MLRFLSYPEWLTTSLTQRVSRKCSPRGDRVSGQTLEAVQSLFGQTGQPQFEQAGRSYFGAEETEDQIGSPAHLRHHHGVGPPVGRVAELSSRRFRVAVGNGCALGCDASRHRPIGVAVLQSVSVQLLAQCGVCSAGDEQRMPRRIHVMDISRQRLFTGVDESADPVRLLDERHAQSRESQFGGRGHAVDSRPDDDNIELFAFRFYSFVSVQFSFTVFPVSGWRRVRCRGLLR